MGQGATTLHAMLHLPVYDKNADEDQKVLTPLTGSALRDLQELLATKRVFFLDEMSTIGTRTTHAYTRHACPKPIDSFDVLGSLKHTGPNMLSFIDKRCQQGKQNDLPFGGLSGTHSHRRADIAWHTDLICVLTHARDDICVCTCDKPQSLLLETWDKCHQWDHRAWCAICSTVWTFITNGARTPIRSIHQTALVLEQPSCLLALRFRTSRAKNAPARAASNRAW
jgi:hypothetical protein